MTKLQKKINRARVLAERKAAKQNYAKNREIGDCFVKDCQNNGDLKTHCTFCDFAVQACTAHSVEGRNKAKRHLMLKHPTKTLPALVMGTLRGQSLE